MTNYCRDCFFFFAVLVAHDRFDVFTNNNFLSKAEDQIKIKKR